jgi:hypothetical protein
MSEASETVSRQASKAYPCSWCDYLFTLTLSLIYGGMFYWYNWPWWGLVVVVHWQTAGWFLKTRSNKEFEQRSKEGGK